jgi:hypothetical protein
MFLCVAQKRQSSARKQQLAAAAASPRISDGHFVTEIEKLPTNNDEQQHSSIIPSEVHNLHNGIDSYSFTDIEVASSINEQKHINLIATPKSIVSHNHSLATTNLSAYSPESLLRKLVDKAQVLDEYYHDISTKIPHRPCSSSLSSSSNSLLDRSGGTPRLFLYRRQSNDSIRKSRRRKYRNLYDNTSSDGSRFDLYDDEDNILRELIRFNNDIDLILSRLEMEGENLPPQQQINHILSEENHPIDDSILNIDPQINDQ